MGRFSLRRIATKTLKPTIMKLLAHFALAGAATASLTADYEWQAWKNQHKVSFPAHEELSRYEIFVASRKFVKEHNQRAAEGLETYTVGLNKFAAMSEEEFEDQGSCGSCWSFATSATLEATMCENGDKDCNSWNGLAPQQLVDCLSYTKNNAVDLNPYDDHGCSGGFITNGVRSIDLYGGQMNWDDYPYVSGSTKTEGTCAYDQSKANLNLSSGCVRLPSADENTMVDAIANKGPLGIGINASGRGFSLYTSGVYSNPSCTDRLNHAVLATGYGTWAATGQDYFEIKNSWGASWGDSGFINVARNDGNMCGVSSDAMYNLA